MRIVIIAAALALSACATPIQQVEEEERGIDAVLVLSVRHVEPGHAVFNNPVRYLGLTGAIAAGTADRSRANALRMHIGEFNVPAVFRHYLAEALDARGLAVEWDEPGVEPPPRRASDPVPRRYERDGYGLRRHYAVAEAGRAQLDLALSFAGYAAGGIGENHPYHPTVMVNMRLVAADGVRVLYQNAVHYNPVNAGEGALVIEPAPDQDYPDFQALRAADPARLRAALQDALRATAYRVAAEL